MLVHITARDVAALLPALQARGFVVVVSRPDLHFVDKDAAAGQLAPGAPAWALAARERWACCPCGGRRHTGRVTTQADYVLEAARTRATLQNWPARACARASQRTRSLAEGRSQRRGVERLAGRRRAGAQRLGRRRGLERGLTWPAHLRPGPRGPAGL
ncbi:MAG: hypothetical protein WKG07_19960 [Hymenobacter sp.]